jgi:hypothetical protein
MLNACRGVGDGVHQSSDGAYVVPSTVLFLYTVYDMLANKPAVENGNSWAVPAFFVDSR